MSQSHFSPDSLNYVIISINYLDMAENNNVKIIENSIIFSMGKVDNIFFNIMDNI